MKNKFWDIKNVLTTLKALVVSIIVGIPSVLIRLIDLSERPMVLLAISGLYGIFALWFWGYLAKSWWKWS